MTPISWFKSPLEYRTWVQATKQYNIGSIDEVDSVRQTSAYAVIKTYRKQVYRFLEKDLRQETFKR